VKLKDAQPGDVITIFWPAGCQNTGEVERIAPSVHDDEIIYVWFVEDKGKHFITHANQDIALYQRVK